MTGVEEVSPSEGKSQKLIKTEQVHSGTLKEQWESFEEGATESEKQLFKWNESIEFLNHPQVDQEGKLDPSFERIITSIEEELDQALVDFKSGSYDITNSHLDIPHYIESEDGFGGLTVNDVITHTETDIRMGRGEMTIDFTEKPWDGQTPPENFTKKSRTILLNAFKDRETGIVIAKLATSEILANEDGEETKKYNETSYVRKNGNWEVIGVQEDAGANYEEEIKNLDAHRTGEEVDSESFDKMLVEEERVVRLDEEKKQVMSELNGLVDSKTVREIAEKSLGMKLGELGEIEQTNYELFADKDAIKLAQEVVILGKDKNDPAGWFLRGRDGDTQFMRRIFVKEGEIHEKPKE